MRKFQFLTSLALLVASVLVLNSCASTNRGDGEQTDIVAEESSGAIEGTENSDLAATSSEGEAKPEETAATDKATEELLADASKDAAAGTDSATSSENLNLESVDAAAASDSALPAETLSESHLASETPKTEEAPVAPKPKAVRHASAGPRLPKIPAEAVQKRGKNLNRFYFLRKGDDASTVSRLFYGTPAMSKELTSWNGKNWSPGTVVYYVSPIQPEDREMRSFYQERNVPAEEYQLAPGESLQNLATARFGHKGSWKEIAVTNGITSPDKLGGGARLALYPAELGQYAYTGEQANQQQTANNTTPTEQTPPAAETPEAGNVPPPGADPMMEQGEGAGDASVKKEHGGGGMDIGKLVEQNLFAVFMIGAIAVLGLLLMVISKRRKGRGGEENFDDFQAPKANRK